MVLKEIGPMVPMNIAPAPHGQGLDGPHRYAPQWSPRTLKP
jgi:hypothetical protein